MFPGTGQVRWPGYPGLDDTPLGGTSMGGIKYPTMIDAINLPATAVPGNYLADAFHQISGTARFYYVGIVPGPQVAPTSGAHSINDDALFAFPWLCRRTGVIDRVLFNVSGFGGGAATIQFALYANTSATNLYPAARNTDLGEKSIAGTGVVTYTPSISVTAGTVYWWAYNADVGSTLSLFGFSSSFLCLLGNDGAFGSPGDSFDYAGTRVYAAGMPDPFTASVAMGAAGGNIPALAIRYSS